MTCSNYPLIPTKYDPKKLEDISNYYSEEYTQSRFKLYLTTEYTRDDYGDVRRFYRLHAVDPHRHRYGAGLQHQVPRSARSHLLKQMGRCLNYHDLGLYKCPVLRQRLRRNDREYF